MGFHSENGRLLDLLRSLDEEESPEARLGLLTDVAVEVSFDGCLAAQPHFAEAASGEH
jgi:hypothetical protein